jgi:putative colanic acid biosynthesis UDP-glucose lipid carrier transferase
MMDLGGAEFSDLALPVAAHARSAVARHRGKRALDVVLAALLLVFIAPLLIVVAILILIDSRGPAFFVQRRTGFEGETINVLKFRTMTVLENGDEVRHAARQDDRVTRIGRFLRRSSIDELPQLVNVIKGEMSLVGPRPHALAHDAYYGALLPQYARRFRARPGITGLAQVSGLRGEIRSLAYMEERVSLDNAYIERWSMMLDLQILARTAAVAAFQSSAY